MIKQKAVGLLLIVLSLSALGFWEFWGREHLSYEPVLVLKADTPGNTEIERNMLEVRMMDHPDEDVLRDDDAAELMGMETSQYVPAGTPLYREYFQNPSMAVGGDTGQYILSIPNEWLMSYPQTLRRGDEVSFYCEGKLVTSALVAYARDSSNQEVLSEDDARLQASAPVSLVEVVVNEEKALLLGKLADKGRRFVLLYS